MNNKVDEAAKETTQCVINSYSLHGNSNLLAPNECISQQTTRSEIKYKTLQADADE